MAAIDWPSIIKPILSTNNGTLNKTDLLNIVKTILRSESEILEHDEAAEPFYKAFLSLTADILGAQSSSICQDQIPQITEACGVIIKYFLSRLETSTNAEIKQYLYPLKSLCEGNNQIPAFDQNVLSSLLKNAKHPEHRTVTGSEKESPKSEMNRSRSDLSTVILQQLTTPLGIGTSFPWAPLSEEQTDCSQIFIKTNISTLQANNLGEVILNVCMGLPILSRYRLKYEDSAHGKSLYLPVTYSEAFLIKNLLPQMASEISILSVALSLPILEPLTPTKITHLSQCAMSALYCAVMASISVSVITMSGSASQKSSSSVQQQSGQSTGNTSTSSQKDLDETEDHSRLIVDKALEIFSTIGNIFKNSTRGNIYQNHLCMGAWLLVTGIQGAMGTAGTKQQTSDEFKGKSPSKLETTTQQISRVNLFKVQQGFGVLNSAIAKHCLLILTELLEDLKIEARSDDDVITSNVTPDPAGFDILGQYTSLQRVVRVLNCSTIQQLLTYLATISYRKACTLKRVNAKNPNDDPISYSDSTTYFNDTFSCSEDSETEEEDSESYLGLWFKETLSPEGNEDQAEASAPEKNNEQRGSTLVAAKDEPHEYLELSAQIFTFLDNSLGTSHKYLTKYVKSGLSEQQMILLANILKDLDRDAARIETENFNCFQWQSAMVKFSGSLGKYLHNIISGSLLNETLQSSLLLHLGVSPWAQDSNTWPLNVYSRSLAVLVQILLLKPLQEKEAACLSVWHRLVNTLVEGVCSPVTHQTENDAEDLNVEHAQLLLFLFHSLNLMQKKSILLLTAGGVIRCAEVCRIVTPEKPLRDNQIMLLSRLLLFLEYLMKHLYNAPTVLLEQVRWNLFSLITLDPTQKISDVLNNKTKMMSFCRKDIEDKFRKLGNEFTANSIRPKFYSLTAIDSKGQQQEFKLDGLAWNFILCTPDKLKYPLLVDALIDILAITDSSVPTQAYCAVHYCFSLCWKLLLGLPPSTPHVESLMQEKTPNLHSLLWSIRCIKPSSHSHYLIVNSLVKQGMYTQYAESLWTKVIEYVSDISFSLRQTISGLDGFLNTFQPLSPRLSKLLFLDSLLSHLYVICCHEKDADKKIKLNTSANKNDAENSSVSSTASSTEISPSSSQQDVSATTLAAIETNREDLTKTLILKILDTVDIVKDATFKLMLKNLNGSIPSPIMESLLGICGSKNGLTTDLAQQLSSLISVQDKDVISGEWKKNLLVSSDDAFSDITATTEVHTLTVIDAHLGEISKNSSYPCLLSMKHTLKSAINLLCHLVPYCKNDTAMKERLTSFLVPLLFDVRSEYVYNSANKCLELLLDGDSTTEAYQLQAYSTILRHSYRLIIDYSELSSQGRSLNLDEIILHNILKFWETMLEKPIGLKAMHAFFYEYQQGNLVQVLISFSNTTLSQVYSTKVLKFFEKLFQTTEKPETNFTLDEISSCVSDLGNIEPSKLKNWLSHILLGPNGVNANNSSNNSSNVQTPTNMATVSAIPSISDMVLDDTDDDELTGAAGGTSSRPVQASGTSNRSEETPNDGDCMEQNGRLLHTLTKYIVTENQISPSVSNALFQALIQLGQNLLSPSQDALEFSDLLQVMVTLADSGGGKGHTLLFNSAIDWLEVSKNHVLEKCIPKTANQKGSFALDNVSSLLRYMADLLQGIGFTGSNSFIPPLEEDYAPDSDDFMDDINGDDDDSLVDDSDEDNLCNKLCTFSITQKEFMNQHWYHCHTCKMVDGVGVCSVCARVCHKNHSISYSKYGNFFCDCGAKEDGTCLALTRRSNTNNQDGSVLGTVLASADSENVMPCSIRRKSRHSSPRLSKDISMNKGRQLMMAKVVEASKESLNNPEQWKIVVKCILNFFTQLMPAIEENCSKYSTVGCHLRAKNAIERLHEPEKTFSISDQIMVATLGSQEGAFENVRMSYSGEQGQTIRQLLSTNLVRRVALCCLASPHGKRQHLAVSHEKGKVTILQLSALLKQADASKRKLTLTRLASAPIPCIVLSLTSNPANEDYLAVCGLKECHILTFSSTGAANEHIVITPHLETGNFIKRAIWLPGSQTKLALVTADFVKIYELAVDIAVPEYHFLVPSGKIRDCTFAFQEGTYYMLLMASSGYIYTQPLADESLAKHGPFYVTNTLELDHPHIKDVTGQIGNGGVSIYYSHILQMLFFSYSQGRSFMAPLVDVNAGVKCVMFLQTGANNKNSSKGPPQPLCQWTEICGHPGLVCAMMQASNNPVIFMIKPDGVVMQEIKAQSSKAKITDMVAIRHSVSGSEKTTLILLCEDGSLRIYSAHFENTGYWLSSQVQPIVNQNTNVFSKFRKNKKNIAKAALTNAINKNFGTAANPIFPVDFFEHCTVMADVEYGGNDLLQIYNVQQLKHRLSTTGLFVTSTKANGFTLEVANNDPNMVITGIRISIGAQDPLRAPLSVTILGRVINTLAPRPRWFDIPLTREESLQSDKKMNIIFGSSQDAENICMLDSIKIYGKTKDIFGWPEETEDVVAGTSAAANNQNNGNGTEAPVLTNTTAVTEGDLNIVQKNTAFDKMISSMLEVLDSGLNILGGPTSDESLKQSAIDISTTLLLYPTTSCVQNQAKCVLATIHGNKTAYYAYKDKEILSEVNKELEKMDSIANPTSIDPEAFYRLVLMARGIAVTRPQALTKICIENNYLILPLLLKLMKKLHNVTPSYEEPATIVKRGLSHTRSIIYSLIEIIYAFVLSDFDLIELMTKYFVDLLLDSSLLISHSAKQAMIRLLRPRIKKRRVMIGSPPTTSTPPTPAVQPSTSNAVASTSSNSVAGPSSSNDDFAASVMQEVDAIEPLGLEAAGGNNPQVLATLESLLGVGGFPQLMDMQPDAVDDDIMEIAIALSLQEHEGDLAAIQQGLANLQGFRGRTLQSLAGAAAAGYNNEASAVGSDDEGSNAATDGSTLRTSPAEHNAGSGGSESGGSGVESIGGTSGRSSTYGDQPNQSPPRSGELPSQNTATNQDTTTGNEDPEDTIENENMLKLHTLRYMILDKMIDNFKQLSAVDGYQAIPFMQVILMLTYDLDGGQETDQNVLTKLLNALMEILEMNPSSKASNMVKRSFKTEVQFIILRFVGVITGKSKSSKTSSTSSSGDSAPYVAIASANALMKHGAIPYCLVILESLLPCWKNATNTDHTTHGLNSNTITANNIPTNALLKPTQYGPTPDMMPFFNRPNLKGVADVFEMYSSVLTEMAVRLPYQVLKLSSGHPSSYDWYPTLCGHMTFTLCEYMMYMQTPVLRRQVRKLLLFICGSKDKYRQLRDLHSLDTHMKAVKKCCDNSSTQVSIISGSVILSYDSLVELVEHLRACQEVAALRTGNWQKFCILNTDILSSLLKISCFQLDEVVSSIILQLLQSAVCNNGKPEVVTVKPSSLKDRRDREKSEESETTADSKFDPSHCNVLVGQIFAQVPKQTLSRFVKSFLLETNSTSIRWQAHSLVYAFYDNCSEQQKEQLLQCLWDLWSFLPAYGKRTAQFVDLLGYLTLNTKSISDKLLAYTAQAVSVLRQQNDLLSRHPNAPIYTSLAQVLDLEGFYLESEPCLVCNNPEVQMSNIKLSTIKIDSKFTTTTTIFKLVQSHTIAKIMLRIADLKRTKMVRTINIYYNNRTVQAVVELKNRPSMWHKARKVTLESGQTDVKIEFPLPITACNLMIEYIDFYETVTSSESLQCPRCSASVPANPGVCGNCGENVFQCHKCRAINYDEKDPFLCHSCGFCKYAKFDYNIFGRPCSTAVDPIESADDRTKTVQTIHSCLEKADRVYRLLQDNKQILEVLVQKTSEHKMDRTLDDTLIGTVIGTSQVNKVIQLLAQKYCVDSKSSFEDLSKIIQKVQACRRELVSYDRSQMDLPSTSSESSADTFVAVNRCYGCALASTEQCLTLLRAMASNMPCRIGLCSQGLVEELAQNNLRRGTIQIQDEVRQLLCLLTRDLPDATKILCGLIQDRVKMSLSGSVPLANLDAAIRHEMSLLESLIQQDDSCWELKLKIVLDLFLNACKDSRGPAIAVIQPCLRIVQSLICPPSATSKINKDSTTLDLLTINPLDGITIDYNKWLNNDPAHSYAAWKSRQPPALTPVPLERKSSDPHATTVNSEEKPQRMFTSVLEQKRMQYRTTYLTEKYGRRWRIKVLGKGIKNPPLELTASWLHPVLFNSNSRLARQLACALITSLSRTTDRKQEVLNLLTSFLKYIGDAGEASAEFLALYKSLADETPWREYLALNGVLSLIAELLTVEIEKIHRLEETTLSSDLAQGYALRRLVELMGVFLESSSIRQAYKGKLLGPVLQGYLSLRKLVVQRTRQVDDAQEKLLEMLEEMTTGTEDETRAFMAVLIDTVQKTPMNDIKTPVFIFERLCNIIHPEENDVGEFFLTLEKDPQQEDFLQGRMLGNPYASTETGLGPLMRDVKNKICMDCELVALLEDDNGMELLVHNKIISLDLPVKEVYKKIWLSEGGERDAMRVVYRMRGLLGDATEEFVEVLNNKSTEEVDNEQMYRMANVLADCGGLKVMLDRIAGLKNVSRSRSLLQVLLKLFLLSVKVRRCQEVLCQPELEAINTLLKVLQLCLQTENDTQQSAVTEQLLEIMETILSKAASESLDSFLQFSLTFGGPEYVQALISCTNCANVRTNSSVLRHLIRVLAALVYGNDIKMALLCEHFKATLDFDKFDTDRTNEDEFKMELFCVLTNQIEHNSIGGTLKDYIISLEIVNRALAYITNNAPCVKPTLLRTDSDELKEFISKPSLKYILRFLTGLATKHEGSQIAVSKEIIPIIHRMEQVSSDEHVGSLAENLLEALCTDLVTATRVQEVRDFTRTEKKRLAMATREKQLDALGMRTNDKGQVTAKGSILQKIEKLRDETGLVCFICREGYACQSSKVLGIYTFSKRTNVEEFEMKPRKTLGYTTVSHFNIVHIDCHMSAIRLARGRDEWESASLQNANTRCNGLLPLWGPDVSESAFSSCMSRHNAYMQESTQRVEITFSTAIHDLKLLLNRFAQEKSFHDDAGGGGASSNCHFFGYLLFYSLYILLSSRSSSREEKTLSTFLGQAVSERWLECAYEVEGPLYQITLSLALHTPDIWAKNKIQHLKRMLTIAQIRNLSPSAVKKTLTVAEKEVKDYSVYKPYLMMWGLIDLIYFYFFRTVTTPKEEDWPISLFDYIRRNDETMMKSSDSILGTFTDEYLPCSSFAEFCDVAGLLNLIDNPDNFLIELLQSLPTSPST